MNKESLSRRSFVKTGTGILASMAAANGANAASHMSDYDTTNANKSRRATQALDLKINAAWDHYQTSLSLHQQDSYDDIHRYDSNGFYSSFSKTLPCNRFGEVATTPFNRLRQALKTGRKVDFDRVKLAPSARRHLANPQGAFRFEISGLDGHSTRIAPSWNLRSPEAAGEVLEVYWQALARDIPFADYEQDDLIGAAIEDLSDCSQIPGYKINGPLRAGNIFRGETTGDLVGPYLSQFLWQDFNFGPSQMVQQYETGKANLNFMTDPDHWVHIQRGGIPRENIAFAENRRYIFDGRSLGEYVHRDVAYQAYLNAAMILLSHGNGAIDDGNPYRKWHRNQGAFTSFGTPFIMDMVSRAANLALSGAWFQKWRMHLHLRPEAFGGRIHFHQMGQRYYEIHRDILNSKVMNRVFSQYGSFLLPQAYSEGSPTHPSYPAGHGAVAGSCVTVLKACFKEDFVLPEPVIASVDGSTLEPYQGDDLTVGNELNKLANNIAIGRNFAGVHYRQDGVQGLFCGEQQAISLLKDQSRTLHEAGFEGFNLTTFHGEEINIKNGTVIRV